MLLLGFYSSMVRGQLIQKDFLGGKGMHYADWVAARSNLGDHAIHNLNSVVPLVAI